MSGKGAAFVGSLTGHGGTVTSGAEQVLIEGKPAARRGDAVACSVHGPGHVSTGRSDVLVGGEPLARIGDGVACVPCAPGGEALVDHGAPTTTLGPHQVYADGDLANIPKAELEALVEAVRKQDPEAIVKAVREMPVAAGQGKGTLKVVDVNHPDFPNAWTEIELTGPSATLYSNPFVPVPRVRPKEDGGVIIEAGGSAQFGGVKVTGKHRSRTRAGTIVEDSNYASGSQGPPAAVGRLEIGPDGIAIAGEVGSVGGGSGRRVVSEADAGVPGSPAADLIVGEVSSQVLVGGG